MEARAVTLRIIRVALALGLAGCGGKYIPLPEVKDADPVAQLNPDRWRATANDLTTPAGDGASHPLPAPVPAASDKGQPL
jgi:hypothetical protein